MSVRSAILKMLHHNARDDICRLIPAIGRITAVCAFTGPMAPVGDDHRQRICRVMETVGEIDKDHAAGHAADIIP
jgi:hypothetical protein